MGIVDHLIDEQLPLERKLQTDSHQDDDDDNVAPIGPKQLMSMAFFLAGGLLVSAIIFVGEVSVSGASRWTLESNWLMDVGA